MFFVNKHFVDVVFFSTFQWYASIISALREAYTCILFSSTLPHRNKALLVFCKESSISKDYLSFEGLKIYHEIAHLNILAIIPSDIHLHFGFIYHYKISTVVKPAKSLNWCKRLQFDLLLVSE